MRRFKDESAHFSFNKCPIYTHDGASAKFITNSQETNNCVYPPSTLPEMRTLALVSCCKFLHGQHWGLLFATAVCALTLKPEKDYNYMTSNCYKQISNNSFFLISVQSSTAFSSVFCVIQLLVPEIYGQLVTISAGRF
jgi:hypothetical protein